MFIFRHNKVIKTMKKIYITTFIIIFFLQVCPLSYANSVSVNDKLLQVSEEFKDVPYALDPLGEGPEGLVDIDPLYRFDQFDCLTFVETVLAKSITSNEKDLKNTIIKIRYKDSDVRFSTRNHFQNPDWLNNNDWLVKNISEKISTEIFNLPVSISETKLNRYNWFKTIHHRDFPNKEIEVVKIKYIPLAYFVNNIDAFSIYVDKPYIFMTIIYDDNLNKKLGTELDVSHTGFLFKKGDDVFIRHASQRHGKVTDENFLEYTKLLQRWPKYLGYAILEIKPQP